MAKRVTRKGGPRVAYPGKDPKSVNMQLTPAAKAKLAQIKRNQQKLNFKNCAPSTGDVCEGLIWGFGDQLVLPEPTRP